MHSSDFQLLVEAIAEAKRRSRSADSFAEIHAIYEETIGRLCARGNPRFSVGRFRRAIAALAVPAGVTIQ